MKIKLEDYIKKLENENKKDKIDKNLPEERVCKKFCVNDI